MELTKIRSLSDAELSHQERTASEQLFRLRFQVALGQNDGVKKLRQLRKEIAQIKTVARERELGLNGESSDGKTTAPVAETAKPEAAEATPAAEKRAKKAVAAAETKTVKAKTAKAKGVR